MFGRNWAFLKAQMIEVDGYVTNVGWIATRALPSRGEQDRLLRGKGELVSEGEVEKWREEESQNRSYSSCLLISWKRWARRGLFLLLLHLSLRP